MRAPCDFSQLNGSMVNVVASMDSAMKTMNLEKVSFGNLLSALSINAFKSKHILSYSKSSKSDLFHFFLQVSALMDKFEQQFENLDVKSSHVEQAMSDVTTLTVPQVSYYFPLLRFQPKGWLKVACEQQTYFVCYSQARLKVVCLKKFCSISFFKKSLRQWHC